MVPEEVLLQLSTSASDMIQASASRTAAVVASAVAGSGQKARNWTEWILNEDNWYFNPESGNPELCGNASGARPCPPGFICLPHVGDNPNYGFTSFDNLLWSMLTTFQLITLDYWENVYNMVRNESWNSPYLDSIRKLFNRFEGGRGGESHIQHTVKFMTHEPLRRRRHKFPPTRLYGLNHF